jgi:DNA-binding transcriptional LysR family regulator
LRSGVSGSLKKPEQGVQDSNSAAPEVNLATLKWDDIRHFRVLAAAGTLRAAAAEQRVAVNTVRARLERLETKLARTLVRRTRRGTLLTDEGRRFLEATRAMGDAVATSYTPSEEEVLVQSGRLTVGCSEGIGNLWLVPRIAALAQQLPELGVDLSFDYNLARDRAQECDVWLTFERPSAPDTIVSKLATVHFRPFASRSYLKRFGAPTNADDLRRHHIVEHAGPGVKSDLLDYLIGSDRPPGMVTLRSNSSLAQLRAVVDGVGIGGLPTFVCELTRSLQLVVPELSIRRELWLAYRGDAKRSVAIGRTIAWLREAFDPRVHPCFAEAFVHPAAMPRRFGTKVAKHVDMTD